MKPVPSEQISLYSFNNENTDNFFNKDIDPQESEEDLGDLSNLSFSNIAITSTDWTTETIINQLEKGNIILDPSYQRRDAWSQSKKSRFIESIFLALPIPQLILAEMKNKRGKYIVIDGKQRLLTLRQFMSKTEDQNFKSLKLTGLEILKDLNKKDLSDLESLPEYNDLLTAFQNQTIRTVVVRNWTDEKFLYLLFLRLNTGSVPLSPQELRQALHPGDFVAFVNNKSNDCKAIQRVLKTDGPDFRMRDVELIVRYYAFKYFISDYSGNMKAFLDETCNNLNNGWVKRKEKIILDFEQLEHAINATFDIFGDDAFKKFNGNKFERRINRAIFDIMTYYFSCEKIREQAYSKSKEIKEAFVFLCKNNADFLDSIETTTKSIGSVTTRFCCWYSALNDIINMELMPKPTIEK